MRKKRIKLPPIGNRIIKSAAGVFICYMVYILRFYQGNPFYSMISALWCIQPYRGATYKMAFQQVTGTLIGAVYGLMGILSEMYVLGIYDTPAGYAFSAFIIIPLIYTTILLREQNAAYLACSVYLSIVVSHTAEANAFIFVGNRVLDAFIGVAIGITLNAARIPRKRHRNVLFIADFDGMLSEDEKLTPFSKVEINRMLDKGLRFSISTVKTPAALAEPLKDVNIKLPVIVMDGAALYDFESKSYLKACQMSEQDVKEVRAILKEHGLNCFINSLCEGVPIIYYGELTNKAEKGVYQKKRTSPYRNYMKREPSPEDMIIYLTVIGEDRNIKAVYERLKENGFPEKLKIICSSSKEYSGYSYLRIYDRSANRRNMSEYLRKYSEAEKFLTVGGSSEDDIPVGKNLNDIVKTVRKNFEPIFFRQNAKKS